MEDDIFLQLSSLFDGDNSPKKNSNQGSYSSEYGGNPDSTMFVTDNMIYPDIKPKKNTGGRRNIVIMETFDNPKNAIFYLNGTIPDMIFIDCYLDTMATKKVLGIIRTYKELAGIPIIYLAEPSEQAAIETKLPEGVVDIISRPVSRGDLQRMLDNYIKDEPEEPEEDTDKIY